MTTLSNPVTLADLPLRPELRHRHAYGAPQLDVPVRLNTNENPHSPSSALVATITAKVAAAAADINRYPDRDAIELRTELAGYLSRATGASCSAESVWAANGSNEILQHLLQAFGGRGRVAMGFTPSYSMHSEIAGSTGTGWVALPRGADFELPDDAEERVTAMQPDVLFVCTPNNPSGNTTALDRIASLYDCLERGILVVDEAYAEFSSQDSAVLLLPGRPRLVVSRTMSKAFGFAGARVGYLAADPMVLQALMLVRLPYHLSALTQAAALAALEHADELLATVAAVSAQRDRIVARLSELGCRVISSQANFVLFTVPATFAGNQVRCWEALLARGILIRDVGIAGMLRVSAGTTAETTQFLDAMEEISR